jgi:hypothetical protein
MLQTERACVYSSRHTEPSVVYPRLQLTDFKTGRIGDVDWVPPDGLRIVFTSGQQASDVALIKNFR